MKAKDFKDAKILMELLDGLEWIDLHGGMGHQYVPRYVDQITTPEIKPVFDNSGSEVADKVISDFNNGLRELCAKTASELVNELEKLGLDFSKSYE